MGERLHPDGDSSSDAALSTDAVPAEPVPEGQAAEDSISQVADTSLAGSSVSVALAPVVSPALTVTPPAVPAPTLMPETPVPSSEPQNPVPSTLPADSTPTLQDAATFSASKSPFLFFLVGFLVLFVAVVAVAVVLIVREQRHRKRRRRRPRR